MSAALQLARSRARLALSRRCMATATAHPGGASPSAATASSSHSVIPLSNVEAQWEKLSAEEQVTVQQQLEELQKKDWKTLSLDEKKAGSYLLFCLSFVFHRVCPRIFPRVADTLLSLQRTTSPSVPMVPAHPFILRASR